MAGSRRAGSDYEDLAANHLIGKGYTIVTRRFSARHGELDLVALDGDSLVFVEVKMRKAGYIPEEAIGRRKIERLYLAANEYLVHIGEPERAFRFDVITFGEEGLKHHVGAFQDLVNIPNFEFGSEVD